MTDIPTDLASKQREKKHIKIDFHKYSALSAMLNGDLDQALGSFQNMQRICFEIGDVRQEGEAAYMVGAMEIKLGHVLPAINAFEKAGQIGMDLNDYNLEGHSILLQLTLIQTQSESFRKVQTGKELALLARLEAIPRDKIKESYRPS